MHTWTLVKIHAVDHDAAVDEVNDAFEDSCGDDCLFDYVSNCDKVTMSDDDKKNFKVETFEELETMYKGFTTDAVESNERQIKEDTRLMLLRKYMKSEDAALLINDDRRVKEAAQEILKNGGGKALPKSLNEMSEDVSELLLKSLSSWSSNLLYMMKKQSTLLYAISDKEDRQSAISASDNHFVDFTLDDEQDKTQPLFYVIVDRHY
jgi:hypothetical protein